MPTPHCPEQLAELLGRLLREQGPGLALYAAQWSTCPDDCVQEALVELASQIPLPTHPVAWLYKVVKAKALNAARGARRRQQREQQGWQQRLEASPSQADPAQGAALIEALASLSPEGREVVVLKVWGNLTFAEIAAVMGSSSSAAHRTYSHGLQQLRHLWEVPCRHTNSPT